MSSNDTIVWVDVPATNLDRAIRFYTAVLGKEVTKESAPGVEFGLLPHVDNNVAGCLVVGEQFQPSTTGPLIYFGVEGRLSDAIQKARDHGGEVLEEKQSLGPHGFRAVIRDSEGNRIALHSQADS